jgi:hypothetical protein
MYVDVLLMYIYIRMGQRSRYNFWIDESLREGLQLVYVRDGVLPSEQIRRAIKDWLTKRGFKAKTRSTKERRRKSRS